MSAAVTPGRPSSLDRILLHLGVLTSKVDALAPGQVRIEAAQAAQELRIRALELEQSAQKSGSTMSHATWLFVWQATVSLAMLAFAAATYFTRVHG